MPRRRLLRSARLPQRHRRLGLPKIRGLNDVDFWIGGLAENQQPFGGLLGSSFNFVFETQMENLQDSDRFYYLRRLAGTHFLTELEGNSFAEMAINNTNIGEDGMHLPGDIFSVPTWILEVDQTKQITGIADTVADGVDRGDPTGGNVFLPLVVRNNPATPGPTPIICKLYGRRSRRVSVARTRAMLATQAATTS